MGFGAIGLIGTLASTGVQMYGQRQAAQAEMQAAQYNQRLAEQEAANRETETRAGIARQRVSNREALAELRNRMAFSGVQTTTGTPLLVAGESAGRMEIEIQDAARRANIEAASLRAKGRMGIWEAQQAKAATRINLLATGLKGASSAFGQYQDGKYQGIY